jgi:hypothetical protein
MKNKKSLMEYMRNRNAMQQPEPPKGTTLKASAARYSETREQVRERARNAFNEGSGNSNKYRETINEDEFRRKIGEKSKGGVMSDKLSWDEYAGQGYTERGKIERAAGKLAKSEQAKATSRWTKKPMPMEVYSDGMANKASQPKGQTLKATPVKAKTGPSSVKMPAKAASKKKKNK